MKLPFPKTESTGESNRHFVSQLHTDPIRQATVIGDGSEVLLPLELSLGGGGENFPVLTTAGQVVALLEGHPLLQAVVDAGEEGQVLTPMERTLLTGGAESSLTTTAADLVAALQAHGTASALVSVALAEGSGAQLLQPMGPMYLSEGGGQKVTHYAWDSEKRLTAVRMANGSLHEHAYDHRLRRIQGLSHTSDQTPGSTNRRWISFVGGLSVAEWESTTLSASPDLSTLAPTVEYQRGPDMGGGVGGLLYSIRAQGLKYNLSNGRGDIVAQSDVAGTLTWTASYEAYGKRTLELGSNEDRQRANTKEEDPTGLLNEGFRYRDLETGVWLSRDPAGFVDGPNLYAYVKQNPWTAFDPDGLKLKIPQSQRKQVEKFISDNGVTGHTVKSGGTPSGGFMGFGKSDPTDTIEGSASGTGLKAEIIACMISSDREFKFNTLRDIEQHVSARQFNVEYLLKIAANSIASSSDPRCSFGPGRYPPNWKYSLENGGWGPAPGITLGQALDSLSRFKLPQFDCSRPIQYGRQWGELMAGVENPSGSTSSQGGTQSFTSNASDIIPGDHVQVKNNNPDAPNNWRYENAVYLGKNGAGSRMFYANGMNPNPTTMPQIIKATTEAGSANAPASIEHLRTHVGVGLAP